MQITKYFAGHFSIFQARSDSHIHECFRIRHKVYCEEFRYEPQRSSGLESDSYDAQSFHCLVKEKHSNQFIGCIRFIQGQEGLNGGKLPIFESCEQALDLQQFDYTKYAPNQIGEVSRLSVLSSHRMRNADRRSKAQNDAEGGLPERHADRRLLSVVPLSLFIAGMVIGKNKRDVDVGIAMMEPSLGRMLRMAGLPFEPVGTIIDYHGPRAPFIIRREKMFKDLSDDMFELYEHVESQLKTPYLDDDIEQTMSDIG